MNEATTTLTRAASELNFNINIMFSQRGVITLAHTRHDLDSLLRWANAMQFNGIAAEILTTEQVRKLERFRTCRLIDEVAAAGIAH